MIGNQGEGAARREVSIPAELAEALAGNPAAAKIFASLSPSHRREHVSYIDEAKRPETRARRARKTVERLLG